VGMGDRVCVDLCSLLRPGEGMLVGSFARALFLVHSEVSVRTLLDIPGHYELMWNQAVTPAVQQVDLAIVLFAGHPLLKA
jgi:hypothetical protein